MARQQPKGLQRKEQELHGNVTLCISLRAWLPACFPISTSLERLRSSGSSLVTSQLKHRQISTAAHCCSALDSISSF